MKPLVAFFSAEGNTKGLAERLAAVTGADMFEIAPVEPYTAADINWKNPLSRCNKEKIGKKDVPVSGTVANFGEYDTVLIGFPIWYFAEPNIVDTFAKGYDWSGKKVALFATSGGSGIEKSVDRIKAYLSGNPEMLGARCFSSSASADEVKAWVESLGV